MDGNLNPEFGETLPACHPCKDALALLQQRRSTPAKCLTGPGPSSNELDTILKIAARAPDHRRVTPFRFIVFEGEARARFGAILRSVFVEDNPDGSDDKADIEAQRFMRAPTVVAVVSSVDPNHRTPEWEQVLTAGAVCQNMLLAACASGYAAQWITEWYAFDKRVLDRLELSGNERIAGYVYIGTAAADPKERARPDMGAIVTRF